MNTLTWFRRAALIVAHIVLFYAGAASPTQTDVLEDDFTHTQKGESLGQEMLKLSDIGFSGCILVADHGEIIFVRSVGFADRANNVPLKPNHLFEIGSLTKPVTALAAMILVQNGNLNLDSPISDHLPGVPDDCSSITVRHLIQHTSGIPPTNYGRTNDGLETAVQSMLDGGPRHEPGSRHEYWNQGYILLSEIIADAARKSYVDVCREQIFEPAGMSGTCFTGDNLPEGYFDTLGLGNIGPARSCLEHPYGSYGLQYRGCGGVVSNVHDLWKLNGAIRDNTLLDEAHTAAMFDGREFGFSLGWNISKTPGGDLIQSHGGKVRGFICEFRRYPETDSFIIVVSNNDSTPVGSLGGVLEGFLFAGEMPGQLDDQLAEKFVGTFLNPDGRRLEIEQSEGHLIYAIHWARGAPVSRGYVLQNDSNVVVLYQPGETLEVEWTQDENESQVQSVTFMHMTFEREK